MAATAPELAFWDALGWQPSQAQRDQLVELQGLLQSWNCLLYTSDAADE